MPNTFRLWWLPDGSPTGPRWSLVLRGTRGVTYSLPCCQNGFLVRKAWEDDEVPHSAPFPDDIAVALGGILGIPGCAMPTEDEKDEVYVWLTARKIAFERECREVTA